MRAYARPSTLEDVFYLTKNLREEDVAELAKVGSNPVRALMAGFSLSDTPYTIVIEETQEIVAMYGVAPIFQDNIKVGSVWLLASPALEKIKVQFLRSVKGYIKELLSDYDLIANVVDPDNKVHYGWIKWCGFQIINTTQINGYDFKEFFMLNKRESYV